jgi:hypothetical protein
MLGAKPDFSSARAVMMKRVVVIGSFVVLVAAWSGACQGPDEYFRSSGQVVDTGGEVGAGGAATGGSGTGTGGLSTGFGGIASTGGVTGGAGRSGSGGAVATGGVTAAGGRPGTGGGTATGGTAGRAATGGATGAAGRTGTGGGAGQTGAAGRTGGAGSTGTAGAGGAANCVDQIRQMGYAYPGAPACSMCKDNTTDLSTKCMSMIDCVEKSYPCSGNCQTNCLNMVGGSGVLSTCVNALVSAACP